MGRVLIFLYGVASYLAFFGTILYAIGFTTRLVVPKAINDGEAVGPLTAVVIDCLLLGLFAVQHAVMARPAFKDWWTKIIPTAAERSTFVLVSSLILLLTFWQWRPLPGVVWAVEQPVAGVLLATSLVGWALVFYSTFLIDHFDLFGLRQVSLHLLGREYHHPPFSDHALYRWVRHPLMAGFLIAFWFTPLMTYGHLLFAALTTGYILIGIQMEERDLVTFLGAPYEEYRKRTPMLVPWRSPTRPTTTESANDAD